MKMKKFLALDYLIPRFGEVNREAEEYFAKMSPRQTLGLGGRQPLAQRHTGSDSLCTGRAYRSEAESITSGWSGGK